MYTTLGYTPRELTLSDGQDASNLGGFGYAVAFGVLPNTAEALDTYNQWNGTYGQPLYTLGTAEPINANTALAALLTAFRAALLVKIDPGQVYNSPEDQVLANITHPVGFTTLGTGLELPTGLSPAVQSQYLAYLQQWFPQIVDDLAFHRSPDVLAAADAFNALTAARNAALAAGVTQTPYGPVASSLIAEGPVVLPDGMAYLAMNDVPGGDGPYVLWWQTSAFVPPFGVTHYGDACGWQPGTGAWYMLGAVGAICPAPPLSWVSDGFVRMSARARASVTAGSDASLPTPGVTPAASPPIYATPAPIVTPLPSSTAVTVLPPMPQPVLREPSPTVIVGTLPPGTTVPPTGANATLAVVALLATAGVGAYLLGRRR